MSRPATAYRLDQRHAIRLLGLRMVIAATLVFGAALALGVDAAAARVVGVCLGAGAVVAVGAGALVLLRPPVVVRLDDGGYRVRRVPECGVRAAGWLQVDRVDLELGPMGQTLVIRLQSGESTSVPLVLMPRAAAALQREVHDRLDTANGYRPLA